MPISECVNGCATNCGRFSGQVHDSYQRRLKDLPLRWQSVVIRLAVRRFLCGAGDCARRTFAERCAQLPAPYARFTTRLGSDSRVDVRGPAGGGGGVAVAEVQEGVGE